MILIDFFIENNLLNICIYNTIVLSLIHTKQQKKGKMKNKETKQEQSNWYTVYDSMGRTTDIYYIASNINDALKAFKSDKTNYQKHYYGKLKRCYNGGVRGSQLN